MTRLICCFGLLLCVMPTLCQADDQALPAAMQGTWLVESLTDSGHQVTVLEGDKLEFTKDKLRVHEPREKAIIELAVKLGGTEPPKFFDLSAGGRTSQGIYEFRDGKLIICFAQPGRARPSEFKSKRGDNRRLYTLIRPQE
jgi:uncharacterized protein (TIGR03067 family)